MNRVSKTVKTALNEALFDSNDGVLDLLYYMKENYPQASFDIKYLINQYELFEDPYEIVENIESLIQSFDTVIFNEDGMPDLYESDDIELAAKLEKVMNLV